MNRDGARYRCRAIKPSKARQMPKLKNTFNPILQANPDEVARRILALIPTAPPMSPEEQTRFDQQREESWARFQEQRHGELPPDTYRILEQGGFVGWTYELEIDGGAVVLYHPETPDSAFQLFGHEKLAIAQARAEIARRHGEAAAERAQFRFMWGGTL